MGSPAAGEPGAPEGGASADCGRRSGSVPRVVLGSIYGTAFIVLGSLLALWSLWWIVKAAMTNPAERDAEMEARARVARGEGWSEDGSPPPASFSDSEMAELSDALRAENPAEAGIDVTPRKETPKSRWRPNNR
jgi:hypothetical protein